jgi:HSP20 family protein
MVIIVLDRWMDQPSIHGEVNLALRRCVMVLQRWYPLAEIRRLEETAGRVRRGFGPGGFAWARVGNGILPLDVEEGDDDIVVRASLPGVPPEDIQVTTEDGVLTIQTPSTAESEASEGSYLIKERRSGSFHRSLRLPDSVDPEKAESSYEHGVLSISLPKQEAKKAKRVEVKVKS